MREILFRAKWISSIWLYGYCFLDFDNRWVMHWNEQGSPFESVVSPETICEYTGVTDKDGNKIFEGDVFCVDVFSGKKPYIGTVTYGEYHHSVNAPPEGFDVGFYIKWDDRLQLLRNDIGYWSKQLAVAGNIFDNPEFKSEAAKNGK